MKTMATLPVFYETRPVGTIEGQRGGGARFDYDPAWINLRGAFPISTTIPLDMRTAEPEKFTPWIANLLPESAQLSAVSFNLKTSQQDIIGILSEIGRDTAGALSFKERGSTNLEWRKIPDEVSLERIINELPSKPFLVGEEGVSMSLAGAQSKIGVVLDADGNIHIPINGSPSTHILKPDIQRLWGSVQNEALCMVLAKRCGLNAPTVTTGRAGARSYLLIERYDRRLVGNRWRRIHQEDFCQALGYFPGSKYERNNTGVPGPKLPQLFGFVRDIVNVADVTRLLDYLIFNVIVCNTDAHSKNYSVLITAAGASLTPIYDVMCSETWENVTRNLANTIAGKTRGDYIKGRHWQREAAACSLNPTLVLNRVESLSNKVIDQLKDAVAEVENMPGGKHDLLKTTADAINQRAKYLISGLQELEVKADDEVDEQAGEGMDTFATGPR